MDGITRNYTQPTKKLLNLLDKPQTISCTIKKLLNPCTLTSGSHERYKSKERLEWAKEYDCIKKFKEWLLSDDNGLGKPITTEDVLDQIQKDAKVEVKKISKDAWNELQEIRKKANHNPT